MGVSALAPITFLQKIYLSELERKLQFKIYQYLISGEKCHVKYKTPNWIYVLSRN